MKTKDKKFEELIWKGFKDQAAYDKLRHNILRIREIMCSSHRSFAEMSAQRQFDYCITIGIIAVQTARKDLNNLRIFRKKEDEVFKYSIDEFYTSPKLIQLENK